MAEHLVWLGEDHAAATREGWDLFECSGSDDGDLQLQRFDCPDEVECARPRIRSLPTPTSGVMCAHVPRKARHCIARRSPSSDPRILTSSNGSPQPSHPDRVGHSTKELGAKGIG